MTSWKWCAWGRPSPTSNSWDVDTRKRRWNLLRSLPLVWSKSTENNRREGSKGLSSGQPTPQGLKSTEAKLKLHNQLYFLLLTIECPAHPQWIVKVCKGVWEYNCLLLQSSQNSSTEICVLKLFSTDTFWYKENTARSHNLNSYLTCRTHVLSQNRVNILLQN